MSRKFPGREAPGVALVNRQRRYAVNRGRLLSFSAELRRQLRLGKREFSICLVDDATMRRLNAVYRGKEQPTDVLSFRWQEGDDRGEQAPGLENFLGEVVISVETARRNSRLETHSTLNEIRWLILHGVLHLLGYDHERDDGEMNRLELKLREKLGIAG
jgi:probable rRNA maturation factor